MHRFDARNIRSWSGIFFFMCRALEAHVGEVVYLGPDESFGTRFIEHNSSRLNRIWKKLTGKILLGDKHRLLAHRLAQFFERRIQESPCDILFAPVAASEIAFLKTDLPIIYCSDITWPLILDYYPDLAAVSSFARAEGQYIESLAVRRASACIFPSDWAAKSCCDDFGLPPESVHQISFGANLNDPPTRSAALNRSLDGSINLIMVGVDWERKGGPIAFECLTTLLKNNVEATLTLCGCIPPAGFEHPRFRVIPFLSKHDPEQWKQMEQLFLDAHFMLFPTRAEALGVVTCEASAFGLPTIATDTGGVCGALREGVNGYAMPYDARGDAYAAKIMQIIAEPSRYYALVVSCRDEYERRLNWDAWGRSMRSVVDGVLNRNIDPRLSDEIRG
ncbi:glycosyltransferase family 4 protein [Acidicapsa acidisoli]|uniref:glycosyltransferase family 4 protein n=1 Tax=Acidicapsa acidisoli TaxID=1615681 RepID=UPI0021E0C4B8|nr:glycosyltransferase family 4 protein [Acidicapsa acidisoli]